MSTRTLLILVALVIVSMGTVLTLIILPQIEGHSSERYIRLNDIHGMSVVYKGKEYTLNFDQQNEVALLLNPSISIAKEVSSQFLDPVPFEKIIIYLFNAPSIEIVPIGFKNDDLIYSVPAWNPNGYLKDVSNGTLKQTLLQTYDV